MKPKLWKGEEVPIPDLDGRWKDIMFKHPKEFIQFFLPDLYEELDLSKPILPLDKELQQVFPDYGKDGKQFSDKIFRVHLKGGGEGFVLVHTEVENSGSAKIQERLFEYFIRLWLKFKKARIVQLVVFIGENVPKFEHIHYIKNFGTINIHQYNTYIVREQTEENLLASNNIFALVILACLYIIKSKQAYDLRLVFKKKLAKLCYQKGFNKKQIYDLLLFVQFAIALPSSLDADFETEILKIMIRKQKTLFEQNPHGTRIFLRLLGYDTEEKIIEHLKLNAKEDALEEAKEFVRVTMGDKIKAEVEKEIKAKIVEEVKEEVKAEIELKVKEEFKVELEQEVKAKVKEEVKAEVELEVKAKVKEEVKAEVELEVKAKVKEEVKAEVEQEIIKNSIIKMYKNNYKPILIASIFDLEVHKVKQIIKEYVDVVS